MKFNYSLEEYKKGVKKFVADTKNWITLDDYKFYTATGNTNEIWEETSDNANGGLDVSWAFHKDNITDKEIVEKFYENIIGVLNTNIENEVDYINNIEINYN